MARIVRIGSAGWSIPLRHAKQFAGGGGHLERYARVMNCAEINTSFNRPHQHTTYARWAASTPSHFRFSVKTPRQATQVQRMRGAEPVLDRFAGEVAGLGRKLAVILVQLPPSLAFSAEVADVFFRALRDRLPVAIACEPRHASWFSTASDEWLRERRIARVAADPALAVGAGEPGGWRGLTYIRLHGSPRIYWSAYAHAPLRAVAMQLTRVRTAAWCILDNTAAGHALGDALELMRMIDAAA